MPFLHKKCIKNAIFNSFCEKKKLLNNNYLNIYINRKKIFFMQSYAELLFVVFTKIHNIEKRRLYLALDFMKVGVKHNAKTEQYTLTPEFLCVPTKDLMIRGGRPYAVWDERAKQWRTSRNDIYRLIDEAVDEYLNTNIPEGYRKTAILLRASEDDSGIANKFNNYVSRTMDDNFVELDSKIIFLSDPYVRENYSTKRLPYDVIEADTPAYDRMMGVLYSEEEREKFEWGIGAVLAGESEKVQKFFVLYGSHGTGKSTVLHLIERLFQGYWDTFSSAALGNKGDSFAMEAFKANPLVAIEHDGNLSRIEDNTRLNSIVSHEAMKIDEKFKARYTMVIRSMLFIGTNSPVKITDAKSGLLRRLIDISPTGNILKRGEYEMLNKQLEFELGGIAYKCRKLYLSDKTKYDRYRPMSMMAQTNDFYNFILENYNTFAEQEYTPLKNAWIMYKEYCQNAAVPYPYTMMRFANELENYFETRWPQKSIVDPDGKRTTMSNVYEGFKSDAFKPKIEIEEMNKKLKKIDKVNLPEWLNLIPTADDYIFKEAFEGCKAQYAVVDRLGQERPGCVWASCATKIEDLITTKTHFVLPKDKHYIFIDFDLKDENGQKSLAKNLAAAAKFPPTYAEVSKGGQGLHLHYIYDGDPGGLSTIYEEGIEVKVMVGNSSIRRRLSLRNNLPMAHINSGLPLKEESKRYGQGGKTVFDWETYGNEKSLRTIIRRALQKEHHGATKPEIDFIKAALDSAYEHGMKYDVTDLRPTVMEFASRSTNKADYCMEMVCNMHFKSDEPSENKEDTSDKPIIFYDVEVFPNLFVVCWMKDDGLPGESSKDEVRAMINPTPNDIRMLVDMGKLVGFNNRDYDNHMLYAKMLDYSNERLFELSQRIIEKSKNAKFGEAFNLSYTDIFDFSNDKKSLKKWEIELGIHHQELGLPWDKPVPENLWVTVADYCKNDVIATKALWHHLKPDWIARQVLAKLSGLTVNDTTNSHSTRIIFGNNRHPQSEFKYTDLSEMFPGYKYEFGKSTYRGEETGEGGYVYSEPGIYYNVALLDVASMHPSSIEALDMFGPYTQRFSEIKQARVCVKHYDLEGLKTKLNGELLNYIPREDSPDYKEFMTALAYALKIVINSVYGLTSARFENPFKDPRNVDNIVAKRGALFMINLKHEVWKKGYKVAHIKTDSIKIPDADLEIIKFVMEYGKKYGYTFEHEATYAKMCLVNDAVYIAKYATPDVCQELYSYVPDDCKKHGGEWTATGAEFAVPYIFKTLFSHEPITFDDLCETKSVSSGSALYLDFNEDVCADLPEIEKECKKIENRYKNAVKKGLSVEWAEFADGTRVLKEDEDEYSVLYSAAIASHNYIFVGRTGQFTPVKPGSGGGELLREKDGKYAFAAGTKGYRWFESEKLRIKAKDGIPEEVDMGYFRSLVDGAIEDIAKYGDATAFIDE